MKVLTSLNLILISCFLLLIPQSCIKTEVSIEALVLETSEVEAAPIEAARSFGELGVRTLTPVPKATVSQQNSTFHKTLTASPGNYMSVVVNGVTLSWTPMNNYTSIKFSDRGQLRQVLGVTSSNEEAHHIIPWQHIDDFGGNASALHPVVRAASCKGFHPNNTYNGCPLDKDIHNGSHPAYNTWILNELESYSNAKPTDPKNYVDCENANAWLQTKLIPRLRTEIAAGVKKVQMTNDKTQFNLYFKSLAFVPYNSL
jgi:A nuclease family of the HNH/ENDO VII superfamily with conserved AHH